MRPTLQPFLEALESLVERHRLDGVGRYARWLWQDGDGGRALGENEYGDADAINILYTLGRLPADRAARTALAAPLRARQDPASGWFRETTHDPIHTTAHCLAALELLDTGAPHQLSALAPFTDPAAIAPFLAGLDWTWNPWGASHRGAGLYAALVLAGEASVAWQTRYFEWLWSEADPDSGLWRRGCVAVGGDALRFHHLAGTFHYLFNLNHARQPLRHPARLVDTCLDVWERDLFPFARVVGFAEVDWVYCLHHALRQSDHRASEARRALAAFATRYVAFLAAVDLARDDGANDLHQVFGALCAVAALQQAVPEALGIERPLHLVLDRRPFI